MTKPLLEFMTAGDAAAVLGCSGQNVIHLTNAGHIHPVATTGRGVRLYRREDVERLRDKRAAEKAARAAG